MKESCQVEWNKRVTTKPDNTMLIPEVAFDNSKTGSTELEIIDLEDLAQRQFESDDPQLPHRLTFFTLIYIEKGTGAHQLDFTTYPYSDGSFIFVQRGQVQAFDFTGGLKGKILIFTQHFLDQVHTNMRLPNYTPTHLNSHHNPHLKPDKNNSHRCKILIDQLVQESRHPQPDPLISMYLFSALSLILHRLQPEQRHDKLSHDQSRRFARFMELLQNHFKKVRDANWYAEQLNTTYKTLNQICKLATGLTVKQLIDAHTVIEIKRSMVVSNTPTQQMAYEFGFEDASNFVKYFRKLSGYTPSQFAKIQRGEVPGNLSKT